MMTELSKEPLVYAPPIINGSYVDNLIRFTWTEFQECGVRCPCTNSKTIHRNKNSFKNQHCKTKQHLAYMDYLNKEPNVRTDIMSSEEFTEILKQMKDMKIRIGREHESLQLEKLRTQRLETQLKDVIVEKEDLLAQVTQTNDYVAELLKTIQGLEKNNDSYEQITVEMMRLRGYELSN